MNNEQIGISAEIAIADAFGIAVSSNYRNRGDERIIDKIKQLVPVLFPKYNIPKPIKHVAEGLNPIDFELEKSKTLSVKTNMGGLGKVAPQNIGQPTSATYFEHFKEFVEGEIPLDYEKKRELFKEISVSKIDEVIKLYWENLFHCDYLLCFYGFTNHNLKYVVFERINPPAFEKNKFSFTRQGSEWNESTTVKYNNISIGEFQVHIHRDCFKFRFNMEGVVKAFKL